MNFKNKKMEETMTTKDKLIQDINNTQDIEDIWEVIDKLPDSFAKGYLVCFIDGDESDDLQWIKEDLIERIDYLSDNFNFI